MSDPRTAAQRRRRSATRPDGTPARVTRRRAQTRQRLIDAAFEVFTERGFGHTRIEEICEAAGYSRGAFYSNFDTLEELFFALYEQQAEAMTSRITRALTDDPPPGTETGLAALIDRVLAALQTDPRWFVLSAEFTLHALRNPELARSLAAHRQATRNALGPALSQAVRGRDLPARIATPDGLARAVIAIYEAAMSQTLLEPDNQDLHGWLRGLLLALLRPEPGP